MPAKAAPDLPDVFGDAYVAARYGLTGDAQRKTGGKKHNPSDPLDLRGIDPQPPSKKSEQQQAAAAARELGEDPNDKLISEDERDTRRTGIRNLGATCYMNSLLQCLFMNPAFRKGIYAWQTDAGTQEASGQAILGQLQLLFASLDATSRAAYHDPGKLTEALRIDTTQQQDAQEFNKLLLTFLEGKLGNTLVQDQFRGQYCYRTTCQVCKKDSASSSTRYPFYELELNVQPTLAQSLREYIKQEELQGVECASCGGERHDAKRQMALVELPPVLTLQLLRFVYDLQSGTKKKVSTAVKFPATIDMADYVSAAGGGGGSSGGGGGGTMQYQLTAVLMHTGSSANSGHYTARLLEQSSAAEGKGPEEERWWNFNDERVTLEPWEREGKKGGGAAVGVSLVDDSGGTQQFSSKTAYMLNYTRVDELRRQQRDAPEPPPSARQKVEAANAELQRELEEFEEKKGAQERTLAERRALLDEVTPLLAPQRADGSDGCWVPTEWLRRALSSSIADVKMGHIDGDVGKGKEKIDTARLKCEHGKADPHKLNEMKLVSTAAWEVLRRHFGSDGPPLGAGPSELCKDCCRVIFDDSQAKGQRSEHGARMASLLKQVPDEYEGNRYMVDKQLKQQWKRWQREGYEDASVHLYCECSKAGAATPRLRPAAQRIDVSEEAMAAVRTVFPQTRFFTSDAHACPECLGRKEQDRKAQDEQKGLRARHRDLLPRLATSPPQPLPPQLPLTLRVLPAGWLDAWAAYVDGGERPPALESGGLLTAQGLLKVHPEVAAGPWPAWQPPPPKTSEPPPPQHELRRALQKKLATKLSLVTAQEYQQLRQLKSERGDELLFPELAGDALLPTCTVACAGGRAARAGAGGVSWDVRPSVCENARMLLLEECRRELTEFSGQVHVHTVRERRQAEAWEPPPAEPPPGTPGLGSPEAINLNGDGGEAPLEAPLSKRPRRACRSGGGAKVTVSANGVDSIGHLKLLCYEKLHDCAPSQMCLYFEGRELLDEQPLQDLGVLDGSTLQLYVDREVAPTDTAALEKLGTKGGKEAVVEASFVGSALLGGSCCAGSVQSDPMVIDSPA